MCYCNKISSATKLLLYIATLTKMPLLQSIWLLSEGLKSNNKGIALEKLATDSLYKNPPIVQPKKNPHHNFYGTVLHTKARTAIVLWLTKITVTILRTPRDSEWAVDETDFLYIYDYKSDTTKYQRVFRKAALHGWPPWPPAPVWWVRTCPSITNPPIWWSMRTKRYRSLPSESCSFSRQHQDFFLWWTQAGGSSLWTAAPGWSILFTRSLISLWISRAHPGKSPQ